MTILVAVIPLHDETGVILSNVFLRLRRAVFDHKSYLVFAGGDGASPNITAWEIVKSKSSGDARTILRNDTDADQLSFNYAGGGGRTTGRASSATPSGTSSISTAS